MAAVAPVVAPVSQTAPVASKPTVATPPAPPAEDSRSLSDIEQSIKVAEERLKQLEDEKSHQMSPEVLKKTRLEVSEAITKIDKGTSDKWKKLSALFKEYENNFDGHVSFLKKVNGPYHKQPDSVTGEERHEDFELVSRPENWLQDKNPGTELPVQIADWWGRRFPRPTAQMRLRVRNDASVIRLFNNDADYVRDNVKNVAKFQEKKITVAPVGLRKDKSVLARKAFATRWYGGWNVSGPATTLTNYVNGITIYGADEEKALDIIRNAEVDRSAARKKMIERGNYIAKAHENQGAARVKLQELLNALGANVGAQAALVPFVEEDFYWFFNLRLNENSSEEQMITGTITVALPAPAGATALTFNDTPGPHPPHPIRSVIGTLTQRLGSQLRSTSKDQNLSIDRFSELMNLKNIANALSFTWDGGAYDAFTRTVMHTPGGRAANTTAHNAISTYLSNSNTAIEAGLNALGATRQSLSRQGQYRIEFTEQRLLNFIKGVAENAADPATAYVQLGNVINAEIGGGGRVERYGAGGGAPDAMASLVPLAAWGGAGGLDLPTLTAEAGACDTAVKQDLVGSFIQLIQANLVTLQTLAYLYKLFPEITTFESGLNKLKEDSKKKIEGLRAKLKKETDEFMKSASLDITGDSTAIREATRLLWKGKCGCCATGAVPPPGPTAGGLALSGERKRLPFENPDQPTCNSAEHLFFSIEDISKYGFCKTKNCPACLDQRRREHMYGDKYWCAWAAVPWAAGPGAAAAVGTPAAGGAMFWRDHNGFPCSYPPTDLRTGAIISYVDASQGPHPRCSPILHLPQLAARYAKKSTLETWQVYECNCGAPAGAGTQPGAQLRKASYKDAHYPNEPRRHLKHLQLKLQLRKLIEELSILGPQNVMLQTKFKETEERIGVLIKKREGGQGPVTGALARVSVESQALINSQLAIFKKSFENQDILQVLKRILSMGRRLFMWEDFKRNVGVQGELKVVDKQTSSSDTPRITAPSPKIQGGGGIDEAQLDRISKVLQLSEDENRRLKVAVKDAVDEIKKNLAKETSKGLKQETPIDSKGEAPDTASAEDKLSSETKSSPEEKSSSEDEPVQKALSPEEKLSPESLSLQQGDIKLSEKESREGLPKTFAQGVASATDHPKQFSEEIFDDPRYKRLAEEHRNLKEKYSTMLSGTDKDKLEAKTRGDTKLYVRARDNVDESGSLNRMERVNNEIERQLKIQKDLHKLRKEKNREKRKKEKYQRKLAEAKMKEHWNDEQMEILHDSLNKESNAVLERQKAMRQKMRDDTEMPFQFPVKKGKARSVRKIRGKIRRRGRDKSRKRER